MDLQHSFNFFVKHIQQDCEESDRVNVSHDAPMRAEWRVGNENPESLAISIPKPDILYGYQVEDGFKHHRIQLASLGRSMGSNGPGNILPFFVVELKSQGPGSRGSLWVAENQVLGGASSCVSMVSYLNDQLRATRHLNCVLTPYSISCRRARHHGVRYVPDGKSVMDVL